MPAHQRVRAWVAQNYQKPAIDQEWLADCSDWISSELGLDPDRDFDKFIRHVEAQLLQSNLADSMVPGSGIDPLLVASNPIQARPRPPSVRGRRTPRQAAQVPRPKKTTGPKPLLVEVMSITEIAHSAFSLLNTHQTRLDRADLGLAQGENDEQDRNEDEGPVPRFPRGMLKFELSDGSTTFGAIEFRSLPQLELGTTPLGYKMFLKSTPVRNGIAFLEPTNVILKGYRTEDHDADSDQVFLRSLRKRLGRPDPPVTPPPRVNLHHRPEPIQPLRQHQPPPVANPPSPPVDIDDMYEDDDVDPDVLRKMAIQMDEIDVQTNQWVGTHVPQPPSPPTSTVSSNLKQILSLHTKTGSSSLKASLSSSAAKTSPYFATKSSESKMIPNIGLSPRPAPPPNLMSDFGITRDGDDPDSSKFPVKTVSPTTAKFPPAVSVGHHAAPEKRISSPDSYDDIAFDMDVDDAFIEQVGKIEQGALATSAYKTRKGKAKDTGTEATTSRSRPSAAPDRKAASSSASGTNLIYPSSSSGAEPRTRTQSSTTRATSASSLSSSTKSTIFRSTQSSSRHLSRDSSLNIISSSEDEGSGGPRMVRQRNPFRRPANVARKMCQNVVLELDVIEISD